VGLTVNIIEVKREFEHIFHRFYSPLCNYAQRMIGNSHDAEDLVQTLFIQLYGKDKLHTIINIENYLLRSVKFKCIDFMRTRQPLSDIELLPDKAGTELQEITEADIEPLFYYYAAKLPPKTREVFLMSRVGQMTYKEIAAELNVSQKTVENQMNSALKKLKSILQKEHYFLMA
jgi:RNA polymerase sigma-70 factor, ECF subfamily